MGFDDRLKQLLEERAGEATPSPEAWEHIQRRLRMRPYVRALAIAISIAAIAGIAFAAPRILDRSRVTILTPASTPSPTEAPPDTSGIEFSNNAFWPLSDEETARRYQAKIDDGADPWMRDPEQVAERFAVAFIGWKSIVSSHDVTYDEVGTLRRATFHIRPILAAGNGRPGPQHTIRLVALPKAENPGWYISELVSDNIVLDQPLQASEITSPVTAKGRGVGFEATLNPEVRDDSGTKLHPRIGKDPGYIMAGATEIQPFEAALEYNTPTTPRGIVIVVSASGLEGPSADWTIVRVRFATTATTSPAP